jgi:hypothetical protein
MVADGGGATINLASFAATFDRRAERSFAPGRFARVAARIRSHALDRQLIAGVDPSTSTLLAARAARLTHPRTRVKVAEGLERLVRAAGRPSGCVAINPSAGAVLENADRLRELATRLRAPAPLYASGVAILLDLITDGTGPAYTSRHPGALARRLRTADAAISGPLG